MDDQTQRGERLWPMAAVTRRTGIGEHTLRAWERRFGFPEPLRLPSGHRRYTTEQVRHLGLIGRLLQLGHRAGDVVGLPADQLERLLRESGGSGPPVASADEIWVDEVLARALTFDRQGVVEALRREATALGAARFVRHRAAPLLTTVGEAWSEGRLGIRHEHLLSEALEDVLRSLHASLDGAVEGRPVLLTTLPGEGHGLGLRLVGVTTLLAGRPVVTLGVETPVEDIVEAVRAIQPVVVGLSVSAATTGAGEAVRELRSSLPAEVGLWLGGEGARLLDGPPAGVRVIGGMPELEEALRQLPPG